MRGNETEKNEMCEVPWYEERWYLADIVDTMEEVGLKPNNENIEKVKTLCIVAFSDYSERNECLKEIIEMVMKEMDSN